MDKKTAYLPDLLITVPVIFLLSLGVLVIYSSAPNLALSQAIFAIVGLLIYWFFSFIDFSAYDDLIKYLYFFSLFLLLVVFVLGVETRGSIRWIPLGPVNLQPSEFAKPILILMLAKFWSNNYPSWKNIFKSFLLVFPFLAFIFKQPDLGTTLTILAVWVIMLIGANLSLLKLLLMGVVSFVFTPVVWFFLRDYQKERISSFLSPAQDPLGVGYNVIQAMIAVGSGEFWGRGLGRGTQSRLQFLPEFRTDFIFASIAEEFGFFGSLIVLLLYGVILSRCFRIASLCRDRFSSLLIMGVLGMLFFQIVINIGMNLGIMPITGITLPLLSYGGSSLVATLISLSFVSGVARSIRSHHPSDSLD